MIARPLVAALIGALIGAAAAARPEPVAPPESGAAALRGEPGLLCSLALLHVVRGVGRRCLAGQDASFQAAVGEAIARLEAQALARSDMSRADLDAFAASMAGDDRTEAAVCDGEGVAIYRTARDGGVERIRLEVDRQLALPGPPQWGTCR